MAEAWIKDKGYAKGAIVAHPVGSVPTNWESLKDANLAEPGKDANAWISPPSLRAWAVEAVKAKQAADLAAQEAARTALRTEARSHLGATLGLPANTLAALTVEHTDMTLRRVVFTDRSLALGVTLAGVQNVRVMELRDGTWAYVSRPVTSLADLGVVLG